MGELGNRLSPNTTLKMADEGCKLFVYGGSENVSRDEIEQEFGRCGTVTDAYNTGKGYAFITMGSPSEAQEAVRQMHQADVFGQTLKVDVAKPKRDGGGGGGYGGRSGGGGYGGGGGGGGYGGGGRGSGCFKCGEDGHKAYECPGGGGGGRSGGFGGGRY